MLEAYSSVTWAKIYYQNTYLEIGIRADLKKILFKVCYRTYKRQCTLLQSNREGGKNSDHFRANILGSFLSRCDHCTLYMNAGIIEFLSLEQV